MRVWPVAMALSIVSQAVCSQPADADISPMKSCFQLERVVQIRMSGTLIARIAR
jgi:hypothetical protein